jgi:CRISPR-associated endonuclease/helicase Cas3
VLTGTMRGKERDVLVGNPVFQRFLPSSSRPKDAAEPISGTVYLVATSAGEIGVNISADDLVCDLTTFESITQRFGRVNRFGERKDTTIDVVHPNSFDESKPYDEARARTLALLRQLDDDASPQALRQLDAVARRAAFSPAPLIRPATDILFDSWSLTTIREPLPGRPPVAPYLHGEPQEWEPPETHVAWRSEVDLITGPLLEFYSPEELLADYPLKPHELLRDRSSRIREQLALIADRSADANPPIQAWLVAEDGTVELRPLADLANKDDERQLYDRTVVLPPSAGGLSPAGLLDGKVASTGEEDVADFVAPSANYRPRVRLRQDTTEIPSAYSILRIIRVIDTLRGVDEPEPTAAAAPADPRFWLWLELPAAAGAEGTRMSGKSVLLENHTRDVEAHARAIVGKLELPQSLADCVVLAARFHDLGKDRRHWQRSIGNDDASRVLAKPGRELRPRELGEPYRHEFGSLRNAASSSELRALGSDERDLVLHLIAAHHGRARPHFPTAEAYDPEATLAETQAIASEIPLRYARLQRRFGRWGLAYLESLIRAADYAASAGIKPATEDNS